MKINAHTHTLPPRKVPVRIASVLTVTREAVSLIAWEAGAVEGAEGVRAGGKHVAGAVLALVLVCKREEGKTQGVRYCLGGN